MPAIEDQPKITKSLGKTVLAKAILLTLFVVMGLCLFFYFDSVGSSMYYSGRPAEALAPTQRALKVQELVLGADSLEVANTRKNLARVYDALKRTDDAEPLYAASIESYEKKNSTNALEFAHILSYYGDHLLMVRRNEDALKNYQRAKEIMIALKQENSREFAWVLQRERNAFYALNRKQEALLADARANQILRGK